MSPPEAEPPRAGSPGGARGRRRRWPRSIVPTAAGTVLATIALPIALVTAGLADVARAAVGDDLRARPAVGTTRASGSSGVEDGGGAGEGARTWRRAIANDDVATLARVLDETTSASASRAEPAAALVATRSANGKSALMVAAKRGDLALARALVAAGADPAETSATGGTPFMFAVLGDRLDVARWLAGLGVPLDARGSNGWSAVTIAAAKGLDATLAWLLDTGAPADVPDLYGFTPLMRAVDNGHRDSARRLLDAGARPDAADESGNTALHHAIAGGRAALIGLLLERGADPAVPNRDGVTPASLAAGLPSLSTELRARLMSGVPERP